MPARNPLIELATRRPVALLMISAAIFVFGLLSLAGLPMDLMPEVSYPTITVRTDYPGAAPEDVEDRVSRRLEQALSVVKSVRRIVSVSRAESSDVILEFTWDAAMKDAVQNVREKLDQTFLPDEAETPSILRYDPSLDPVLQIGLVGDRDLRSLRYLAEEEIERRLETVPGVAAVKVRGGLEEEIRVEVEEDLIRNRGITVEEISRRLREENLDQASGLLEDGEVTYVVRTRNELRSLQEIEDIPIRREKNSVVRISDVARVISTHKDEQVITRLDGKPAVKIDIYRESGVNIVDLVSRVRTRIRGTEEQQEQLERWRRRGAADEKPEAPADEAAVDGKPKPTGRLTRPDFVVAYLPDDVRVETLSDQSVFIEGAIEDLKQTAILGGVLAILVLFLFLGRLSFTAVVAVSIPFSVVATFAPMYIGGISLNIMSLGGLALGMGMLVDSSIVVLEAIFRRREEGASAFDAAIEGASEVGGAVFASTLTTVAVFVPIVFVEGMAGQVFRDQSLTVVFSLLASLAVSLTIIPMLAARFTNRASTSESPTGGTSRFWRPAFVERWAWASSHWGWSWILLPYLIVATLVEILGYGLFGLFLVVALAVARSARVIARIGGILTRVPVAMFSRSFQVVERAYARALELALDHRLALGLVVVLGLVLAQFAASELGSELMPEVSQGEFEVRVRFPVGTPVEVTAERVVVFERALVASPAIGSVATTVGVDPEELQDTDDGEHTARLRVRVADGADPLPDRERRALAVAERVFSRGMDVEVQVERPALFSFRTPMEVEIRGHDLSVLKELTVLVKTEMEAVPSLSDVRMSLGRGSPEYHLYPDREKLARNGVDTQTLADVLRRKNLGEVATRFRKGDRKVDVRVQLAENDRDSVKKLLDSRIRPTGSTTDWSIGDFVTSVDEREGPSEIRRIDQQRAAVVSANLTGLDLGRVSAEVESRLLRRMDHVPPEFDVEVVGQKKEMERSRNSLLAALLLAIFLVYVVMASQFESLVQPFVILFTIPLAAVGVTGTLWLTETPLSIMTFLGMIVLAGIVVNNAIVLVDQINQLRRELPLRPAILEAGRRRLRPILMTTATTVLAMIPLTGVLATIPTPPALGFLFGSGEGAEIRAPMAYTVIGGLVSSTFLTLVVVPVLYSVVVRGRLREEVADV